MSTEKKVIPHVETEPIFSIHIDFADGSNPIVYYNLSLARVMDVLKEWYENWILYPDNDCKLNSTVWFWHARARTKSMVDPIDPPFEDDADNEDDVEGVEQLLEDSLSMDE